MRDSTLEALPTFTAPDSSERWGSDPHPLVPYTRSAAELTTDGGIMDSQRFCFFCKLPHNFSFKTKQNLPSQQVSTRD